MIWGIFFSPQNDGIYQQDSARCYTSRSVCAGFEERQDEFTIFPWPVKLPDLIVNLYSIPSIGFITPWILNCVT